MKKKKTGFIGSVDIYKVKLKILYMHLKNANCCVLWFLNPQ